MYVLYAAIVTIHTLHDNLAQRIQQSEAWSEAWCVACAHLPLSLCRKCWIISSAVPMKRKD